MIVRSKKFNKNTLKKDIFNFEVYNTVLLTIITTLSLDRSWVDVSSCLDVYKLVGTCLEKECMSTTGPERDETCLKCLFYGSGVDSNISFAVS